MKTEEIDRKIGMPDVDQEWARFEREVIDAPRITPQPRHWTSRAAAIALACVLGGLAVAATLLMRRPSETRAGAEASRPAVATASAVETAMDDEAVDACYDEQQEAFVFDDVELQHIARYLEREYSVEAVFVNDEARHVRFYVTLSGHQSLLEIVELLNNFQHVQLRLDGQRLIIE